MPIEITELTQNDFSFVNYLFNKVKFNDIVNFTRQLSIMLTAGLTLSDSFTILKKQTENKNLNKIIDNIDRDIRGGKSFSDSLKKYPENFSNLYIALIRAGEASGKMSDILKKLADNLEKQRALKGKIKGSLIYPAIIIAAMIVVMFIMITFVMPKLLDLYKNFDVALPLTTKVMIAISNFSAQFWPLIVITTGIGIFFIMNYLRTKPGKYTRDAILLKLPVVNKVIQESVLVDSTRTLAILIESGVSILEALTIVIDTTDNVIYQDAFRNILYQVEKGVSIGQAMTNQGVFPPILIQMTTVGEQTGNLDNTLMRISNYFDTESELAIRTLTTLIEPAVLVVLGVGVGVLVFSIITPIYTLTTSFH